MAKYRITQDSNGKVLTIPCQSTQLGRIATPTPHLLAVRLRDARLLYEQEFGHPPQECDIAGLDGWAIVEWLDQAVATAHVPKGPSTYTPPAPYRVFRLLDGNTQDQTSESESHTADR